MTPGSALPASFGQFYLLRSRFFTHASFWVLYYLIFSLIWKKPEQTYFASFYLEFVLMPVRILASYCMIYFLIPKFLTARKYTLFFSGYAAMLTLAGLAQLLFSFFFYYQLLPAPNEFNLSPQALVRNMLLINTTVLLIGAAKVFQLYIAQLETAPIDTTKSDLSSVIEVKSERRTYRLRFADIIFVEGLGNYVTYHIGNGDKRIVYASIKETQSLLPDDFIRLHRSYIVNKQWIDSYSKENVIVNGYELPRGKEVDDSLLQQP